MTSSGSPLTPVPRLSGRHHETRPDGGCDALASSCTRRDPCSTDSPGSCAQKCTSRIWGRAVSIVVSSSTAVAGSHSANAPGGHDLARVGEAGRGVRRAERAPGDVGVELGEDQRADLGPLPLGVLGDQTPTARRRCDRRLAGPAVPLERVEVGLVVVVLRGEEPVARCARPARSRARRAPRPAAAGPARAPASPAAAGSR